MANANSTGRAEIVLGLSPGDPAPVGIFELAQFSVTSISTVNNDATALLLDNTDIQIVDLTPVALAGNIAPANLTLNPVLPTATSTPTETPPPPATSTPTVAVGSPSPTPDPGQPTLTPTDIPIPTSTSAPTLTPSPIPAAPTATSAPTATPYPTLSFS